MDVINNLATDKDGYPDISEPMMNYLPDNFDTAQPGDGGTLEKEDDALPKISGAWPEEHKRPAPAPKRRREESHDEEEFAPKRVKA
jgi:hypothetical protein